MPTRRYSAFLVRQWSLPGGVERIEVQHIQSGETARIPSLQAALDWMGHRGPRPPSGRTPPDPESVDGEEVPETESWTR